MSWSQLGPTFMYWVIYIAPLPEFEYCKLTPLEVVVSRSAFRYTLHTMSQPDKTNGLDGNQAISPLIMNVQSLIGPPKTKRSYHAPDIALASSSPVNPM